MAKYRLRIAHELETETRDGLQRIYLPGDVENDFLGEERGTIVGDGTSYIVKWPTLEMIPLDDEAREMIAKEEARIAANQGAMNPIEELADNFEDSYVPGTNRRRRAPLPDGAPVRQAVA